MRLVSFAVHWIRAEIHEFILRNWRIVKVATTKAQRKLFFNLRKQKKRLGWLNQSEVNAVADDLGVKPEVVMEMESRLAGQDIGFDMSVDDDESTYMAPAAYLEGWRPHPTRRPKPTIGNSTITTCCLTASKTWMTARATSSRVAG